MADILIIAEAGVNHNGSLELAMRLVDKAAEAGADIVKFQTFHAEDEVSMCAPKAEYQKLYTDATESQLDMIKKLELAHDDFRKLKAYCDQKGIGFLSTPFDEGSVDFLNEISPGLWKIPSGEITSLPFLRKIGALGQKIILSTGMATLGEIEKALEVLEDAGTPPEKVTLLHCTTEYPAAPDSVNLHAMETLRKAFPHVAGVGYSDHTEGIEISLGAAALGAALIEKHFTLDRNMEGPDHAASLEPDELKALVRGCRKLARAMGNGVKKPSSMEMRNRMIARKSLVARRDIKKGEILGEENMTIKRPGTGISAMRWDEYCGKPARRDYRRDELI